MKVKKLLFLCGLLVGSSACMGQTQPAPNTSPLPAAASIAEHAAVQARRLEAERRSGVIFETSQPGRILVDGQSPDQESPSDEALEHKTSPETDPDVEPTKPAAPAESEHSSDPVDEAPSTDPEPAESDD